MRYTDEQVNRAAQKLKDELELHAPVHVIAFAIKQRLKALV